MRFKTNPFALVPPCPVALCSRILKIVYHETYGLLRNKGYSLKTKIFILAHLIASTIFVKMAGKKRSKSAIEERTGKRRKQEDELLAGGFFTKEQIQDIGDSTPSKNSWEDDEQDYELKPRSLAYTADVVEGLPIKINGKVERVLHEVSQVSTVSKDESEEESEGSQEEQESDNNDDTGEVADTEEAIIQLKEEIADLVEKLMEETDENISALTRLRKMAQSKNPNTCKFSMLALVPVFKSIIPGYRIRPLTEAEKKERVSKDVAKLRNFEETLVLNYKAYLDLLAKLAKTPNNASQKDISLGNLAANAATELATSASHFNFRADLLTILIRRICKPNPLSDPVFKKIIATLESLLNEDQEGNISSEIVRILAKTLKTRKFLVDESVLNILLSLEVLQDYDPNTKTEEPTRIKLKKKNRVHLSKKERKARKETKKIEEEMRSAEQSVSAEEREKNQSEILKTVLSLYLFILKINNSKLVGSVLEGLSKFGRMANFDLLGDFLEVMKEIIVSTELNDLSPTEMRKVLLCIVTAFSLVASQNYMKVSVDLSSFVDALYTILPMLSLDADIEFSHKSLRLADPLNNELAKPSVNVSTKAELLLKALDHVFFRSKSGSKLRAKAFAKRMYIVAENTPEKTTIAILKFLDKLMSRYPEIGGLYSTDDRIGNGVFHMNADIPSRSNAEAATVWENALLLKHYSPTVGKGVRALMEKSRDFTK